MSLLQMTLSGGAFILLITAVRALALHRLPKGTFLALWELAALRLLLPFAIPLPVRFFTPPEHLPVVGGHLAAGGLLSPGTSGAGVPVPAAPAVPVLPTVYLAVAVLLATAFAVSYARARRRFSLSRPDDAPAVRRWLADLTLFRTVEVRRSALIASPLTYGVLRPVILLPEEMDRTDEDALRRVLTHELIHILRFDAVAKLAFAAALCVHWFNPLVWAMYVLANRDLELSCDEQVLDALGNEERAAYALTLLDMEETRTRGFSPYNHFSKLAIEERIKAIMKYKKASLPAAILAAALVLGATTAFAVSPQADQPAPLAGSSTGDSTVTSYFNPEDGKNYYSWDGGKTWEPLTNEEFAQRFSQPNVEWWTYEEYAAWLENEKVELQSMLGEKSWTGGRGEFTWTQEVIDETIAMYENILQEIKEGKLYSKSVDGDTDVMLSSGGAGDIFVREEDGTVTAIDPSQVRSAFVVDGSADFDGLTFTLEKTDAAPDDWDVAQAPQYTEAEWRQIISDIESGKIPPFEIPDDPNVTVRFVNYPGCVAPAKEA